MQLVGGPKVNEAFGDTVPAGLQVANAVSSTIGVDKHNSECMESAEEGNPHPIRFHPISHKSEHSPLEVCFSLLSFDYTPECG